MIQFNHCSALLFLHKGELVHNINTNANQGTICFWILSSQCPFNFQGFREKTQEKNKNMPNDIYYRFINPNTYILLSTFLLLNMHHYNTIMPTVLFEDHASVIWQLEAVTKFTHTHQHAHTSGQFQYQYINKVGGGRCKKKQSCVRSVIRLELGWMYAILTLTEHLNILTSLLIL